MPAIPDGMYLGEDGQWYEDDPDDDDWLYDSEDEVPSTLMERYENFWRKKKEGRKHPTLKYLEKKHEMDKNNAKLEREEYRKREKRRRKKKLRREIQQKRNHAHKMEVARLDRERHERDRDKRHNDAKKQNMRMYLFEKWGIASAKSRKKKREGCTKKRPHQSTENARTKLHNI